MPSETKRPPRWTGILQLCGCFAALCSLFSLIVTAGVAWQEYSETHWPEATATIRQCYVERASRHSTSNIIDCRIVYPVGNETVMSSVRSGSWPAPEKVIWEFHPGQAQAMSDKMQGWVEAHPQGTTIAVRYNPASHAKAALVTTDMPIGGARTPGNVQTTESAAALSAALLIIAAFARRLSAS
ncbi:MAG: DUF3592 domain-containing protein [Terriglobales bacterium]|jgi:hypothetical protein